MTTHYTSEIPYSQMDRRPDKRPKIEVTNVSNFDHSRLLPQNHGDIYLKDESPQRGTPRPSRPEDDKDGNYVFQLGENLASRYKIQRKIGRGTYGLVVECWDNEAKAMVAIKIVKNIKNCRESAATEIDILQLLGRYEDRNNGRCNYCVRLRNWFEYRNHFCLVLEKLGPSLFDLLRKNSYGGSLPVDLIRDVGKQLLECVAYMHEMRLVHTDLKPENILFASMWVQRGGALLRGLRESTAVVKVIDFGSAARVVQGDYNRNYVVTTRHYRAPEVILRLGWSYPCDIWSVGCILLEMCFGKVVFQTHDDLEHLAMMERVLGHPVPVYMLSKTGDHHRNAGKFVRRGGRLNWPPAEGGATRESSIEAVMKLTRIPNLVMKNADHSAGDLIRLLEGLLKFDPSQRLTAPEALRHPFFARDQYRRNLLLPHGQF
ncbi:OLC1v1029682C1 [Oldenlandia corymbosa var. corymbosa]|uniref:OLC1v1029682C1 n=1 Tax=Oldenlandia corymbosa var. corymbosa TaxID=529605 RepID=A0AAV1CFV8_OLDCO|nr:OLC1v1029682C1 [Oldenlandia corymbosa var. corymbosa]